MCLHALNGCGVYICTCNCMGVCVHVGCAGVHVVRMYACMCACVYVYMCVCVHVFTCICVDVCVDYCVKCINQLNDHCIECIIQICTHEAILIEIAHLRTN